MLKLNPSSSFSYPQRKQSPHTILHSVGSPRRLLADMGQRQGRGLGICSHGDHGLGHTSRGPCFLTRDLTVSAEAPRLLLLLRCIS